MNAPRIPLISLLVSLPLIVGATPVVKIITPTKSPTTNPMLSASGTAAGVAPLAVYYSLNGSAFSPATGSTNWTVANVGLAATMNTFSVYAQDATGVSKTNTVKFFCVVKVPITVQITGQGTVSIANGEPLEIGKRYSVKIKAAKGFGVSATLDGNPIPTRTSFVMESNTVLAVDFNDITRPVCIITFPAVKQTYTSPINFFGRASDNVGVTAVFFRLNDGPPLPPIMLDATNWEMPGVYVDLNVGTNVVRAYAVDAAYNYSLTNTVKFYYVSNGPAAGSGFASASLAGQVGVVTIGDEGPFQVCFGENTYARMSENGNEDCQAGTYSYTVLSSNMAQLNLNTMIPPSEAGSNGVLLVFTNYSSAIFTNEEGSNGVVVLSSAPSLLPPSSTTLSMQLVDNLNNTIDLEFGGGLFTNTDELTYTNFGTYTMTPYSPWDMVLTENFTDPVNASNTAYVQLDFFSPGNGFITLNQFDNMGNFLTNDSGGFGVFSEVNPVGTGGDAPNSAAGLIWNVSPTSGAKFQQSFGASTYSRTSSDTSKDEVGIYSYVKTGPNTAQFTDFELEPLLGGPNGNGGNSSELIDLTFTSKSTAAVFRNGTKLGTIGILAAPNFAPASLSGRTFTGFGGTLTLNTDGTFLLTSPNVTDSGNYTYAQFTPNCGMINWTVSSVGEDQGKTVFVQLTFTSATGGELVAATFNNMGQFDNVITSRFSMQ